MTSPEPQGFTFTGIKCKLKIYTTKVKQCHTKAIYVCESELTANHPQTVNENHK